MEFLTGAITLLKITLAGSLTGLGISLLQEVPINYEKKIGRWFKMDHKKVKGFTLGNEHCTVIGLTQHGKTYATIRTLEGAKEPVLFFNSQHTKVNRGWLNADGDNTTDEIIEALKDGKCINFLPEDSTIENMSKQLGGLTNAIYSLGKFNFRFAIDECHLFWMTKEPAGKNALIRLATTGLGRGFKCLFLSQRPAKVDNTLYTQSTRHIVFALGMNDISYLKNNNFPAEEMAEKVDGDKYKFIEFDMKEVKGAYMIE